MTREGIASWPVMDLPVGRPPGAGGSRLTYRWELPTAWQSAGADHLLVAPALALALARYDHGAVVVQRAEGRLREVMRPPPGTPVREALMLPRLAEFEHTDQLGLALVVDHAGEHLWADLVFRAQPRDANVAVDYDPTVYDLWTVEALCRHASQMIIHGTGVGDAPFEEVPLLTDSEEQLLLVDWNGREASYSLPPLISGFFEHQSALTPDAVALEQGGRSITYRALDVASSALAESLRAMDVQVGTTVAVHAELSLELFAAVMAIFRAGGAFLYLDPVEPAARLARILALSEATHVIGDGCNALSEIAMAVPLKGVYQNPGPAVAVSAADLGADGESTAYLLFTSGSTGEPKGVQRSHRMCGSRVVAEQSLYGFTSGDRHLLKSPISWREFIWPLATGGTCVLADPGRSRDDQHLVDLLMHGGITAASFVPSVWRVLLDAGLGKGTSLRHAFAGGEPLMPELEMRLRACGTDVHNTYVLTEAEFVTVRPDAPPPGARTSVIGRPVDMRVYLCDTHGELVPPGVPGEICTGGPGLASGYIGRPDLTSERFIFDRHHPQGGLVFRTGDLARHRHDGQLEYLGRLDRRVKVRGLQVDPAEVERTVRHAPGVSAAAVLATPSQQQGAQLTGYIELNPGSASPTHDEMRDYLSSELPAHMVPRRLVFLERLPLMPSGKIDYAGLPALDRTRPPLPVPATAPRDQRESVIHGAFEAVLEIDGIGIHDEFRALGGDSMLALVLRQTLEVQLGTAVSLADVIEATTIAELAARLGLGEATPSAAAVPTKPGLLRQRAARAKSVLTKDQPDG